jgi:hypothetical protein
MCKEIESIKNITVYQGLTTTDFYQNVTINNQPDECIIRSINYAGPSTDTTGVYLIWSDLINDFIGSFAVRTDGTTGQAFNLNPQIKLLLTNKQVPSNLHFVLYTVGNGSRVVIQAGTLLSGDLSISMDFIQYKK